MLDCIKDFFVELLAMLWDLIAGLVGGEEEV